MELLDNSSYNYDLFASDLKLHGHRFDILKEVVHAFKNSLPKTHSNQFHKY